MSISEPFIRRPIGTSLLMLGVLVFGIGAYGLLPVAPCRTSISRRSR
jgi:multidrug efflux pump